VEDDSYWVDLKSATTELEIFSRKLNQLNLVYWKRIRALKLAAETADDSSLEPWIDTQINEYLGLDELKECEPEPKMLRRLELIPRILIFFPVIWTWICLASASSAFSSLIAEQPSAAQTPFLTLWHQNFGGYLYSEFSFQHFTIGTVYCLLIIIGTIALLHYFEEKLVNQAAARFDAELNEFRLLLSEVDHQLSRHRLQSPARFVAHLSTAAESLLVLHANAAKVLSNLDNYARSTEVSTQKIESSYGVLANQIARMELKLDDFNGVLESILRAENALAKHFAELPGVMESVIKRTENQISSQLVGPINEVKDALDAVENYERMQIHAVEQLASLIAVAFPDVRSLAQDMQEILRTSLEGQQAGFEDLRDTLHSALGGLRNQLIELQPDGTDQ